MQSEFDTLKAWVGRRETAVDHVTAPLVHRMAAMLDRDEPMPRVGDPLPAGWHSVLFPRVVRQSRIGLDGHPVRGDFLPPVPLPRRVNGGKRMVFHAALRVGDEVRRESVIQDVQSKVGRSGRIIVVTVRTDISSPRGLAVTEEQDLIYREEPRAGEVAVARPQAELSSPRWQRMVIPDEVLLFRYAALNFNAHRIHYDVPYVTRVEGYPGLIVNGGLSSLLVFELVRGVMPRRIVQASVRNLRVMFVNRPLTIAGEPSPDGRSAKCRITDCDGMLALSAEFGFAAA